MWERGGAYLDESESVCGHPLSGAGGGGEEAYQGLVHLALVVRVSLRQEAERDSDQESLCWLLMCVHTVKSW